MKNLWFRVWFPGLCAFIIVGLVYFFFIKQGTDDKAILNNPLGLENSAKEQQGNLQGPTLPDKVSQNINQPIDNQKIMSATLHTNMGDVTMEFNPNTPKTVENFVKLAKSGFYDGTKFHRVIKGFMNQGGDPLSKDDSAMARWGTGGPGYQFADEINQDNRNAPGTVAMANSGPNTNGSQFFINAADNSFLDKKHTVFAMVTVGADVVMAINAVKTGENDRPVEAVIIKSITLK